MSGYDSALSAARQASFNAIDPPSCPALWGGIRRAKRTVAGQTPACSLYQHRGRGATGTDEKAAPVRQTGRRFASSSAGGVKPDMAAGDILRKQGGNHFAEAIAGAKAPDQVVRIGAVDVSDDFTGRIQAGHRLFVHIEHFQIVGDVDAAQRRGEARHGLHDVVGAFPDLFDVGAAQMDQPCLP